MMAKQWESALMVDARLSTERSSLSPKVLMMMILLFKCHQQTLTRTLSCMCLNDWRDGLVQQCGVNSKVWQLRPEAQISDRAIPTGTRRPSWWRRRSKPWRMASTSTRGRRATRGWCSTWRTGTRGTSAGRWTPSTRSPSPSAPPRRCTRRCRPCCGRGTRWCCWSPTSTCTSARSASAAPPPCRCRWSRAAGSGCWTRGGCARP
mmetsp:Transcript_13389/g.21226  ORF Transcript_13389/g.21226 Transcript_13389/m.21226 type:complete len:205 (-) Transcript_13389:1042-1656(-)